MRAAFDELEPRAARAGAMAGVRRRGARALAGAAGVAAASAPRSDVGRFVRGVLGVGEPRARPALVHVPGGGRLLVAAGDGAWVVATDGAKRRLGAYAGASWSPHGKFAVVWRGRELTAVDPAGEVRWSLPAPAAVSAARWAPGDGYLVAYRAGDALRIVGGDGAGDRRLAAARPGVAPAWRPDATHTLAYADARGRVASSTPTRASGAGAAAPLAGVRELLWSPRGDRLLALGARRLVLYGAGGATLASRALPAGTRAEHAAWAPRGTRVALVRIGRALDAQRGRPARRRRRPARAAAVRAARALRRAGVVAERALAALPWPDADQWLFLRPDGTAARRTAVANIARQFAPGADARRLPALGAVVLSRELVPRQPTMNATAVSHGIADEEAAVVVVRLEAGVARRARAPRRPRSARRGAAPSTRAGRRCAAAAA